MPRSSSHLLSVLLVEGQTERVFYDRVKSTFLTCPCTIEVIRGLYNINTKILHALRTRHTDSPVRAYCCLDRESRYAKTPQFDLGFIRAELRKANARNVLSVDAIIATQMIESWFFHDLAGIYRYLRVPKARRNLRACQPVERFRVEDLRGLFHRYNKEYYEGEKAKHLVDRLDIELIHGRCRDLQRGVSLILSQAQ